MGMLKKFLRLLALILITLMMNTTANATVKQGDRGAEVEYVQQILIAKGLLNGVADGICGEETVEAIKAFQKSIGLEADGICGNETLNLMLQTVDTTIVADSENYVIKEGMRGADVEELQNILIALGYMNGVADGICGRATVEAIKTFQSTHGLVADGVCGTATFDAINTEAEAYVAGEYKPQSNQKENISEKNTTEGKSGSYAEIGSVIKGGMHGEGVRSLQQKLIDHGFLTGHADGIAGERTVAAIKRFQKAVGLEADGVCGLATYAALEESDYNVRDTSWKEEVDHLPTLGQSMYVEATAYSPFEAGNRTARGNTLRRGIIAVDPRIIPLGTRVYIPGYGEAIADDTGGAIIGNRIDIAFDTYEEAMTFGRQYIEIYILDN